MTALFIRIVLFDVRILLLNGILKSNFNVVDAISEYSVNVQQHLARRGAQRDQEGLHAGRVSKCLHLKVCLC